MLVVERMLYGASGSIPGDGWARDGFPHGDERCFGSFPGLPRLRSGDLRHHLMNDDP